MSTLPACLPAAVAVCLVAAAVCAVGLPVCGWIDWRERRRTSAQPATGPRRALYARLSHELRSSDSTVPETAERRSEPQPRKEAP